MTRAGGTWRGIGPMMPRDVPARLGEGGYGHGMFICGDVARIRALFETPMWRDVIVEKWREDHSPLAPYPTPLGDQTIWQSAVTSYPESLLDKIRNAGSVWLITVKAIRA